MKMTNLKEIIINTPNEKYKYIRKGEVYDIRSDPTSAVISALLQYSDFLSHISKGHEPVLIGEDDTWPDEAIPDNEKALAYESRISKLPYDDLKGIEAVCESRDCLRIRLSAETAEKITGIVSEDHQCMGPKMIIELALRFLDKSEEYRKSGLSRGFNDSRGKYIGTI